ncbi:malate:quinone oxidoreductase, partial [Cytobacillus oceanisediminis]|uniref:malate:quinone oxidoreductase n=1 Tax=Cytobacillus oceanisediminis TaxID=665099 RepID=UPI00119D7D2F
ERWNEWNNAGSGDGGVCELKYRGEKGDGWMDISKGMNVNEEFEVRREFWCYLVKRNLIGNGQDLIRRVRDMRVVEGEKNVRLLKKG